MSRRSPRGMTLIEILVAMSVLALVMTIAMSIFIPSLQRFEKADTDYDTQRSSLMAVRSIAEDLRESRYAWLSVTESPLRVCIPSPRDLSGTYRKNADGTPSWQSWIVYWTVEELGSLTLRRQVMSFTFPPAVVPWAPSEGDLGARKGRQIATGLYLLEVKGEMAPTGRARVRVLAKASRVLRTDPTTYEGGTTVEIPH